jgi:hypothetical protein
MLIGSNNYIANQIFLEVGADLLGGPVSLEKSLRVANEILAKHGLPGRSIWRKAPASAAATISPPAASPTSSHSSRRMPT